MAEVPSDDCAFAGVALFLGGAVENHHAIARLGGAGGGLRQPPHIARGVASPRQEPGALIGHLSIKPRPAVRSMPLPTAVRNLSGSQAPVDLMGREQVLDVIEHRPGFPVCPNRGAAERPELLV